MKKSHRLRLSALTAQASRTDAEAAELATLQALAEQHPDAAQDTEDAAPLTLTGVIASAFAAVRSKARLGSDLSSAQSQIATLTTDLEASQAALARTAAERDAAQSQLSELATFFGLNLGELSGKASADVSALIAQKVSAIALDQVASMGFDRDKLPAATSGESKPSAKSKELTYEQFSTLSPGEKMEFSSNGGRLV